MGHAVSGFQAHDETVRLSEAPIEGQGQGFGGKGGLAGFAVRCLPSWAILRFFDVGPRDPIKCSSGAETPSDSHKIISSTAKFGDLSLLPLLFSSFSSSPSSLLYSLSLSKWLSASFTVVLYVYICPCLCFHCSNHIAAPEILEQKLTPSIGQHSHHRYPRCC